MNARASLALILLLLSGMVFLREPDLTDESYALYEAQATWQVAGMSQPMRPNATLFGAVLGIPLAVFPHTGLLALRAFSVLVWLGVWSLFLRSLRAPVPALALGLLLHTWYLPILNYWNLPALLLALAWCGYRAGHRPPAAFAFGAVLPWVPLCFQPLLLPTLLLFAWGVWTLPNRRSRAAAMVGAACMFLATFLLVRSMLPDHPNVLAVQLAGNLPRLPAAQLLLSSRAPRIAELALTLGGCLTLGLCLKGVLVRRLLAPPPLFTRLAQVLIAVAALCFSLLWVFEVRRAHTLIGLISYGLLVLIPVLLHWARVHGLATRDLCALTVIALLFGSVHAIVGGLNTTAYYLSPYGALLWAAFTAIALQIPAAPETQGLRRHGFAALLLVNLLVFLTHAHRGAPIVTGNHTFSDEGIYRGLALSAERSELLRAIDQSYSESVAPPRTVVGLDQLAFVHPRYHVPPVHGRAWHQGRSPRPLGAQQAQLVQQAWILYRQSSPDRDLATELGIDTTRVRLEHRTFPGSDFRVLRTSPQP